MKRYHHRHHIGGSNLSQIGRAPYLKRMREKGEKIIFKPSPNRWKLQCYCGNYEEFYKYRGRYYCGYCGWWYKNLKVLQDGEWIDMLDSI